MSEGQAARGIGVIEKISLKYHCQHPEGIVYYKEPHRLMLWRWHGPAGYILSRLHLAYIWLLDCFWRAIKVLWVLGLVDTEEENCFKWADIRLRWPYNRYRLAEAYRKGMGDERERTLRIIGEYRAELSEKEGDV